MIKRNTLEAYNIIDIRIIVKNNSMSLIVAYQLNVGGDWTAKQTYAQFIDESIITQLMNAMFIKPLNWRDAAIYFGNQDITKYQFDLTDFEA